MLAFSKQIFQYVMQKNGLGAVVVALLVRVLAVHVVIVAADMVFAFAAAEAGSGQRHRQAKTVMQVWCGFVCPCVIVSVSGSPARPFGTRALYSLIVCARPMRDDTTFSLFARARARVRRINVKRFARFLNIHVCFGSSRTTSSQKHMLIVGWFGKFEFVMHEVFLVNQNSNLPPSNNRWVVSHDSEKLENISCRLERHVC